MTQYLLAVHSVEGEPMPSEEQMQQAFKDVDALNSELQSAGDLGVRRWPAAVVLGDRGPRQGGEIVTTDGPFAETKEQLGGFWIIDVPDLDVALDWARKATVACAGPGRGPAVPGRSEQCRYWTPRPSSAPTGKVPGVPWPPWSASSATSTSPKRRSRRRSPSPRSGGRQTGVPPNPGGWIVTTARNKALDRLRRESSRYGREAQAALLRLQPEAPDDLAET